MAIVFRCIRDDECPQFGLFARDISDDNDKHTAEAHVANGKSKTGWISATRSLEVALKNFIKYGNDPKTKQNYFNRIVIIDTDYLDEGYEDCANRTDWKQEKAIRFGREAQEIAIRGCVPPKAIETVLINDKAIDFVSRKCLESVPSFCLCPLLVLMPYVTSSVSPPSENIFGLPSICTALFRCFQRISKVGSMRYVCPSTVTIKSVPLLISSVIPCVSLYCMLAKNS